MVDNWNVLRWFRISEISGGVVEAVPKRDRLPGGPAVTRSSSVHLCISYLQSWRWLEIAVFTMTLASPGS